LVHATLTAADVPLVITLKFNKTFGKSKMG
jgi:hypothetical protein